MSDHQEEVLKTDEAPRLRNLFRRTENPEVVDAEDIAYMRDLHAAMMEQSTPKIKLSLYLIVATLLIALIWANFAVVEEITQGEGKVTGNSGEQIIQSLEGGIVAELYVKEGDVVEQGQEFGFIKFGSRVDVFLPLGSKVNVEIGEVVLGGVTVLASLPFKPKSKKG